MNKMNNVVAVCKENNYRYPKNPPFNPPERYPEFNGKLDLNIDITNSVYSQVRNTLRILKLDKENLDTQKWNPLRDFVKPGQIVFIKPNMIAEKHRLRPDEWDYVITHGSVIRPIIDYLFLAMDGKGRIIIGDGPQTDSNFFEIVKLMGLREIQEFYSLYKDFEISIINLQNEYWITKDDIIIDEVSLYGDPLGNILFNLGKESYFSDLDYKKIKFYGAGYNVKETNQAHSNGNHMYLISKSPIIADVFINIPKLKTHKKCGITVNLKSLVGINANKNFLPHYIFGSPKEGGDQFPIVTAKEKLEIALTSKVKKYLLKKNPIFIYLSRKLKTFGYKIFGDTEKTVRSGNWYGNDTVWRMALDLNKILLYGQIDGKLNKNRVKKYFSIVDGIVAMEGNGPVAGDRKECGVVIAGFDPVAVDFVSAKIMGFNPLKIKIISEAFKESRYKLTYNKPDNIKIVSNFDLYNVKAIELNYEYSFKFKPHFGWVNHIEDRL